MSSKIEIWNYAISNIGVGKTVSSLTEKSNEAYACARFYDLAVGVVLGHYDWPFATKIADLVLTNESDPAGHWAYVYQYPVDCVRWHKIVNPNQRVCGFSQTVPFRIFQGASTKVIMTDQEFAQGEYTARVADESQFPDDFVVALSWLIASQIAPRVTGGDTQNLVNRCLQMYELTLSHAAAESMNESRSEAPPESEFIRSRDGNYTWDWWGQRRW